MISIQVGAQPQVNLTETGDIIIVNLPGGCRVTVEGDGSICLSGPNNGAIGAIDAMWTGIVTSPVETKAGGAA